MKKNEENNMKKNNKAKKGNKQKNKTNDRPMYVL